MPIPHRPINPVSDDVVEYRRATVMDALAGISPVGRAVHEAHIEALADNFIRTGYIVGRDTARKQAEQVWRRLCITTKG